MKNAIRHLLGIYREGMLPRWDRETLDECKSDSVRRVRVGIVGAGSFAQNHLKVLDSLTNTDIVGLCATGSSASKAIATEYNIPEYYSNIDEFLQNCEVDAIFIVVPLTSLWECSFKCLSKGKSIFVEKPVGFTSEKILELQKVADENNLDKFTGIAGMLGRED